MSYSKFGSIVNSDEGITLAVVEEAITYAVNENNKRIKLMSDGWDDAERGFNLISTNPFPGPEMTLRTLVPGDGIEISTINEGQDLRITNTGSSGNSSTIHTSGTLSTITFGFLFNRGPSGSIEPEFLALPRDINLKGVIDRTTTTPGVNWRFNQIGFDCALTIAPFALGQLSAGGTIQPSWALGFAEYDAGFGIFPVDYLFRLTIVGLPTVSKPVASHLNVQLGTFPITAYHVHTVSGTTGPPSNGGNHTHTYASYSLEKEMTTSLGVSIHSFDEVTGTMVLHLRNLSPNDLGIIHLLSILLTSTFSLTWTAVGAVDGSLNPDTSGPILAANGLTVNTNVTARLDFFDSWINTTALSTFGTLQQQIAAEAQTRSDTDSALTDALVGKANSNDATFTGITTGITADMVGAYSILQTYSRYDIDTKNAEIATHVEILDGALSSTGTILETNGLTEDSNVTAQIESLTTDLAAKADQLEVENRLSTKLDAVEYSALTLNSTGELAMPPGMTGASLVHSTSAKPIFKVKGLTATNGVRLDATLDEVNVSLEPSITTAISNALVEITQSFSAVFGWADNGGTTATVTCFISKIGSQVQFSIPTFMVNSGNVQRNTLPSSLATPIPATFRPAIACNVGMCVMTTAATRSVGLLWVNSVGDMLFYRDATNNVWLSGITAIGPSPRTSCFSWSTAAV